MQFPDHQLMLHLVAAGGLFAGSGRKYSEFQTRFTFGCFGFKFQHLRSPFLRPMSEFNPAKWQIEYMGRVRQYSKKSSEVREKRILLIFQCI
jgi:hypothetical protein